MALLSQITAWKFLLDGQSGVRSPDILLRVVLPGLQDLSDVRVKLRMVEEEVHGVLDALDPNGDGDVVVAEMKEVRRLQQFMIGILICVGFFGLCS